MRLGSKLFLTSALVIVVLASVGGLSLLAVDRLVFGNREIAAPAGPALPPTASRRAARGAHVDRGPGRARRRSLPGPARHRPRRPADDPLARPPVLGDGRGRRGRVP